MTGMSEASGATSGVAEVSEATGRVLVLQIYLPSTSSGLGSVLGSSLQTVEEGD